MPNVPSGGSRDPYGAGIQSPHLDRELVDTVRKQVKRRPRILLALALVILGVAAAAGVAYESAKPSPIDGGRVVGGTIDEVVAYGPVYVVRISGEGEVFNAPKAPAADGDRVWLSVRSDRSIVETMPQPEVARALMVTGLVVGLPLLLVALLLYAKRGRAAHQMRRPLVLSRARLMAPTSRDRVVIPAFGILGALLTMVLTSMFRKSLTTGAVIEPEAPVHYRLALSPSGAELARRNGLYLPQGKALPVMGLTGTGDIVWFRVSKRLRRR